MNNLIFDIDILHRDSSAGYGGQRSGYSEYERPSHRVPEGYGQRYEGGSGGRGVEYVERRPRRSSSSGSRSRSGSRRRHHHHHRRRSSGSGSD